mmetsp:Transcript_44083/g.134213  ORF Transcript_44083/g.134213 Transcript_44083/m.134213 type:complete len:394 (+) Transcript_44083:457-1638(+)
MRLDHVGPHVQPVGNVCQEGQNHVHREESLRKDDAPNGRIVQRPLEPLIRVRVGSGVRQAHGVPRQGTHPLGAHRIALVRHGRGSDLGLGEGLLHLLQVGEEADVAAHFVRRLGNAREDAEYIEVDLAGVRLSRDGDGPLEPHELADALVQHLHLLVIAVEQFQEGRLRPRRSLHAAHGEVVDLPRDPLQVEEQILHPQRGALPDRRQLRRLVVRESERGKVPVLHGELLQDADRLYELPPYEDERVPNLNNVGVVPHVARRRAEVDDGHRRRRRLSEGVDVSHDVVAELPLLLGGKLKVDVVQLRAHLLELLVRYVDAELLLGGREGRPELPPRGKFHRRGPYERHFLRGVALHKRMLIHLMVRESTLRKLSARELGEFVGVAHLSFCRLTR